MSSNDDDNSPPSPPDSPRDDDETFDSNESEGSEVIQYVQTGTGNTTDIPSLRKGIKRMVVDEGDQAILDGQHSARFSAAREMWSKKKPEKPSGKPPIRVVRRRPSFQIGSSNKVPESGRSKPKWVKPSGSSHSKTMSHDRALTKTSSKSKIPLSTSPSSSFDSQSPRSTFSKQQVLTVKQTRDWVHISDMYAADPMFQKFLTNQISTEKEHSRSHKTHRLTRSFSSGDIPVLQNVLLSSSGGLFLEKQLIHPKPQTKPNPSSSKLQSGHPHRPLHSIDSLLNVAASQVDSDDSSSDDDLDTESPISRNRKPKLTTIGRPSLDYPRNSTGSKPLQYSVQPSPLNILMSQSKSLENLSTKIFPSKLNTLPPLSSHVKRHSSSISWVPPVAPLVKNDAIRSLKGIRLIMRDMLTRRLSGDPSTSNTTNFATSTQNNVKSSISSMISSLLDTDAQSGEYQGLDTLPPFVPEQSDSHSNSNVDSMAIAGLVLVVDRILSRLDPDSVRDLNLLSSIDEDSDPLPTTSVKISDSVALAALATKIDDLMDYPENTILSQTPLPKQKIQQFCNSHALALKKPMVQHDKVPFTRGYSRSISEEIPYNGDNDADSIHSVNSNRPQGSSIFTSTSIHSLNSDTSTGGPESGSNISNGISVSHSIPEHSQVGNINDRKSLDIADLLNTSITSMDSSPLYPHKEFKPADQPPQEYKAAPISTTFDFSSAPTTASSRPSLVDLSHGSDATNQKGGRSKKGGWKKFANTLKKGRKSRKKLGDGSIPALNSAAPLSGYGSSSSLNSPNDNDVPESTGSRTSSPNVSNHNISHSSLSGVGTYDGDSDTEDAISPRPVQDRNMSSDMGELSSIMEKMQSKDLTDQRALAPSISGSKVVSFENFSLN